MPASIPGSKFNRQGGSKFNRRRQLWGFDKVRYRGLAKNATRSFVALGLANIYLARGVLYEQVRP